MSPVAKGVNPIVKRAMITLLACLLALPMTAFAQAEATATASPYFRTEAETEAPAEAAPSYLAVAQWDPDLLTTFGAEGDANRTIFLDIIGHFTTLALLPEEAPDAESFIGKGVRVTFDAPLAPIGPEHDPATPLAPVAIEIVGEVRSGQTTEVGADYILHDVYAVGTGASLAGDPQRYVVTEETVMQRESPMEAGVGCEVIVDGEGVLLAVIEGNG